MSIGSLCISAELASALGSEEIAEPTYQLLAPLGARDIIFGLAPPILIDRALAVSARVLGRRQLAEEHLTRARRSAAQAGATTELALTALETYRLEAAVSVPSRETTASASDAWRHLRDSALGWPVDAFGDVRVPGLAIGVAQPMPDDELSPTERDVIAAWAGGMDEPQIAARLLLSEMTVGAHLRRTRERLRIGSRADAGRFATAPPTPTPVADLTRREREVLQLIALGKTNAQIAEDLVISQHTAIRHVANILEKTGCANRTEAARLAGDS
jgi:DNA-binding NarL/FixJ family response regulator